VVTGARNTFEAHKMFDEITFHKKELLPFYDLHLKGKNNGFMEAQPVRVFVRGANVWRAEEEWPPKRASYVPYYLRKGPSGSVTSLNDGGMSADKPPAGEPSTSYTYPDWQWVNGVAIIAPDGKVDAVRRVLTFTTAPLEADVDVTGPIVLKLFASSTAIDTQFIVKLSDVHPQEAAARAKGDQPTFTPVAKGWLKASHREKDEARSTPTRPFYTHTNPQSIKPGEIYEFDIEVLPVSYVWKKGHRIRLEIANGDHGATDSVFVHPYHPTLMGTDTFHHDAAHASRLMLPVVE
jgi:putative CocE/NonD family hydrolase